MMEISIQHVYRGWAIAAIGPREQVEYTIQSDGEIAVRSYDSVRTFIKLYLSAANRLESDSCPSYTVFTIERTTNGISFSIANTVFETTFEELRECATDALNTIISQLDDQSSTDERADAIEVIANKIELIDSTDELYEYLRALPDVEDTL